MTATAIGLIAAALAIAALAWMYWEVKTAPAGEENDEGFGPVGRD